MRIISGYLGKRRIHPPASMPHTRPTTDVAKEGLFNILENNLILDELETLDLFGGTGCISFELASRGSKKLTVVENDHKMHSFIKQTSANFQIENMTILKMDVFQFLKHCTEQFNFIFAGPPYALAKVDELPLLIFDNKPLKKNGWFVLEHTPRNNYKNFQYYKTERNYGTTIFSILIESRD